MSGKPFEFEWDEAKALTNLLKHGVSFELARTVFHDPCLLTIADLEHSQTEERWLSIGLAGNGAVISVAYLWSDADPGATRIRLISARKATQTEVRYYREGYE